MRIHKFKGDVFLTTGYLLNKFNYKVLKIILVIFNEKYKNNSLVFSLTIKYKLWRTWFEKGSKECIDCDRKKKQLNLLNNGKISIDLNKTTSFMKQMEIYGKADEKLEIDLSKTKNMFQ